MSKEIIELFGHAPTDLTKPARLFWDMEACPFIIGKCTKHNHDQSIVYGTCSVSSRYGDVIICPNRLYANKYAVIKKIAEDAFGTKVPFYFFSEYLENRAKNNKCVVCLGQNSGKEVKVGKSLSMDWVLALIENQKLQEYVGAEVQSIDITGNYRDAWHTYKNLPTKKLEKIPTSGHGLNWANVHKRLIPQLIRKGLVYSRSKYVKKGLYFIVPEAVYKKFEEIIGEIPLLSKPNHESITVHAYSLGAAVKPGTSRDLIVSRTVRFSLDEFSQRFVAGANLPTGEVLDQKVKDILGLK